MVFTGYFKTQNAGGMLGDDCFSAETSINVGPAITQKGSCGSIHYRREACCDTIIYLHNAAATEPNTDGSLNTTDYSGESAVEYSGSGIIKSFTSETGFFTSNQTLDKGDWTLYYLAKASGVDAGKVAVLTISFYKRNSSNNDTLLFSKVIRGISTFYSIGGDSTTVTPVGTVATTDRLRIRISFSQEAA